MKTLLFYVFNFIGKSYKFSYNSRCRFCESDSEKDNAVQSNKHSYAQVYRPSSN